MKLPKLIYHGRSHASCHSRTNIHQRILFPSTQAPTLHYLSATLKRKADQSQHLIFKRNMRPSFYAAAALATSGLQASALALPAHDRSFIDLVSPGQAEPSNLDERSINWWPATNCVSQISKAQKKERKKHQQFLTHPNPQISCISTCLGVAGVQNWWYDDSKRLPVNRITTFST